MMKQKALYNAKDFPFSPPVFIKFPPQERKIKKKIDPNKKKEIDENIKNEIIITPRFEVWYEDSIYYLWFEYLRRSKKYWFACKKNGVGMEKLYADFGDVFKDSFDEWFATDLGEITRGKYLFGYKMARPTFEVFNAEQFGRLDLNDYFVVAINKLANKKKTLKQVGRIWDSKEVNKKVNLKTVLYLPNSNTHNINSLKEYLKIYDAKLLGLKHWECVAKARGLKFDTVIKEDREYFNIIASKALKKAKKLIALTEQGQFI